jgi:hypothetical protein
MGAIKLLIQAIRYRPFNSLPTENLSNAVPQYIKSCQHRIILVFSLLLTH